MRDADDASRRNTRRDGDDDRQAFDPRRSAGIQAGVLMVVPVLRRRDGGDIFVRIGDRVMRVVLAFVLMCRAVRQRLAGDGDGSQREQGGDGQS